MANGATQFDPNAPYSASTPPAAAAAPPFDPNASYAPAAPPSSTIGPAPSFMQNEAAKLGPAARVLPPDLTLLQFTTDALDHVENSISHYTEEGKKEHPVLSRTGDFLSALRELLVGGQEAGKPEGTSQGFLNSPVVNAMVMAPGAEAAVGKVFDAVDAVKMARAAKAAEKVQAMAGALHAPPEEPGIVQQVLKGERVAQPQAQAALRQNPWASARTANQSLRTTLENPIESILQQSKANYTAIDDAAGTDIKALSDKLDNIRYNIRQTVDPDVEARLELARKNTEDALIEAKQQVQTKLGQGGLDRLDKADQQFKQAQALKDLQKRVFKNPTIIQGNVGAGSDETVNVNEAVKALQKLQDDTRYGAPRLEQALGQQGAQDLLKNMYAAQKSGMTAMSRQQFAKLVAKFLVGGTLLDIGYHVVTSR